LNTASKSLRRILPHSGIGLLCGAVALFFSVTPVGTLLELKGYDLLHVPRRYAPPPKEIVLVAIDEPSFAELQKQWPWPRSLHAGLIDALNRSGASVIGFDILFSEPSREEEDAAFADALKRAGNVILASDISTTDNSRYQQEMLIEPLPAFSRYARTGLVTVPIDKDFVLRRLLTTKPGEHLFAEQVASLYLKRTAAIPERAYISYVSPPGSIPTVSYYQALEPAMFLPPGFFNGKIVIVGRATTASPKPQKNLVDYFATPFLFLSSAKSPLMSGMELHAIITDNVVSGQFVSAIGMIWKSLIFALCGIAGSFLHLRWRPIAGALASGIVCSAYLAAAYAAFAYYRVWTPTLTVLLAFLLPYGIFGVVAYIQSERKKREIKKAFSHYLSPSVLESVLSDPDNIKLGGKKVTATVLFADIAGFTAISEQLQPEVISNLLNTYMSAMTGIILRNKGTIDKFIGDAIMAFWGAPLPDTGQALNACRAALEMQERLTTLRKEFREKGLPEISVRIGINTGPVIAGNMGSADLFDYTVLGDTVNLASRLENANKQFGTGILISGYTYHEAADKVDVRPLGNISVKGKAEQIAVYELLSLLPPPP